MTPTDLGEVPLTGVHYATEQQTYAHLQHRVLYNVTTLVNQLLYLNNMLNLSRAEYSALTEFDFGEAENATYYISQENWGVASEEDRERGYMEVEVLEWWLVEPGLLSMMRDAGMVVMEAGGLTLWGRTCSGQSWAADDEMRRLVGSIHQRWSAQRDLYKHP